MDLLQPMMVVALLASGMGAALLGSIKVPLAARLQIDEARMGGLVSLFGFTLIPVILMAGFVSDLVGRQIVLIAGSVLMAASLGMLAGARSYLAALGSVILLSTGWALSINVGNVLMPLAFPGNPAYSTNLGNVFFGAGAFLTPLGVALLMRRTSFTLTLAVFGVCFVLPGVLSLGIDFASLLPAAAPANVAAPTTGGLLADPILWLCGLALFFYGPLEASVSAWATSYLGEQGHREAAAAGVLSGFWLSFMAARLATAFLLPAGGESGLIVALSVGCVGVLAAMVLGKGPLLGASAVLAAGAIFGPIFPTLMAILLGHFAPAQHGRAVGLLFAIGGVGWTVIPMLIGATARRWGVRRGFTVAIAAAVGLTAVAIGLRYVHSSSMSTSTPPTLSASSAGESLSLR